MVKNKMTYKLPEGWIWTSIGEIAVLYSGGTPSRANSNFFRGNIPCVNRKQKCSDFGKKKYSHFGNNSAVILGTILQ